MSDFAVRLKQQIEEACTSSEHERYDATSLLENVTNCRNKLAIGSKAQECALNASLHTSLEKIVFGGTQQIKHGTHSAVVLGLSREISIYENVQHKL